MIKNNNLQQLLNGGLKQELPIAQQILPVPQVNIFSPSKFEHQGSKQNPQIQQQQENSFKKKAISNGISVLTDYLTEKVNPFNEDSDFGRVMGTLFSQGVSSAGNNMANNLIKGIGLTEGLSQNVGSTLAGTGTGIAANYLGQGINALGGDSRLSRGLGQGIATGVGTIGGALLTGSSLGNSIKTLAGSMKAMKAAKAGLETAKASKDAFGIAKAQSDIQSLKGLRALSATDKWNLTGLGGQMIGTGLQAAFGPSKEYGGKYGNITQTMDTIYDLAQTGIGFVPGVGQGISGLMALNKGLSNIFGSTDGMTLQDSILGSAFMPAPVKWLNMWGSSKTGTFNNQSWQNSEKANSFMGNAFGNLQDRFDRAREEAGKTYGTFSQGAKRRAQENIDFANAAWGSILSMADQNILQNIRSQAMSSINNQRYAQNIQGGWSPIAIGKQGMKIFNNATNHNIGMRLLSAAALIDNKQMILCSVVD